MHFGSRLSSFACEKSYSRFYPSPFTFSLETPINTGVARGEGLVKPFTAISSLYIVFYVMLVKGVFEIVGKSVGMK